MEPRSFWLAMLGIGVASLFTQHVTFAANASFHLEEATIAEVQRAIRAKEITATQLVNLYFKRIEAYNGTCVKGDVDPTTDLMLGVDTDRERRANQRLHDAEYPRPSFENGYCRQ
jgi:hypothetical protein